MKIAFFEIEDWEKDYFKNQLSDFEVSFFNEVISKDNVHLVKDCQIISVFTDSQINETIFQQLPELKMIVTRSTGFDHVDLKEAKKNKILVSNVPIYGENTVAEHTFALILDLSRNIHKSIQSVKEKGFAVDGLRGFDLKQKTLGIIGMGHIGSHVARIANGFEMNVLAFDKMPNKKLAKTLGFKYVSLEELLKNSDIISLHIIYNDFTHHLINSDNINLIKRGAYLINTSRGGIIDTMALVKALEEGILAGAGLDVLEEEYNIKEERELLSNKLDSKHDLKVMLENHILMERDNVIITPHNAFNSKEALERILETTVFNIKSFAKGKLTNLVQ